MKKNTQTVAQILTAARAEQQTLEKQLSVD